MKVRINSLVELEVEQIKISGAVYVGGKLLAAGVNKTLDASIVAQLPPELVGALTGQVFGADYSAEELQSLIDNLTAAKAAKLEEEEE
ncbi:MAG: hypothetical protein IKS15_02700 [Opitutales bacterium]|nr:hypothetical protein [Opitutales bacterium]